VFVQGYWFFIVPGGGGATVRTAGTTQFLNTSALSINTTLSFAVDVTAQWAAASANLSISLTNLYLIPLTKQP
jgi:hypothetical protein